MKTFAQTILIYYICAKYKIRMIRKFTAITRCVKNLFQTQINRGQNVEHQSEEGAYHHFSLSLFLVSNILEFLSSEAEQQCDSDSYYQEKLHTACYISALAGRASPFTV